MGLSDPCQSFAFCSSACPLKAYLGVGVIGASEIGLVRFLEALARALREVLVVVEDAACRICCQVNFLLKADVCQIQHAQYIHPDGLQLHSTA